MIHALVPDASEDDLRQLAPSKTDLQMLNGRIGSVYLGLLAVAKTGKALTAEQEWIMCLTRAFAAQQRELKETLDMLEYRKGLRG